MTGKPALWCKAAPSTLWQDFFPRSHVPCRRGKPIFSRKAALISPWQDLTPPTRPHNRGKFTPGRRSSIKKTNPHRDYLHNSQLSSLIEQLSIFNCPFSIVHFQLSIFNCQFSILNSAYNLKNHFLGADFTAFHFQSHFFVQFHVVAALHCGLHI